MCGFAGYYHKNSFRFEKGKEYAIRMANAIVHRGPDDSGEWIDGEAGIALAHRRLSILDLTPAGHQPMVSPSGRYVIVFNGEIYNHLATRKELEQELLVSSWHGYSDTETLLMAIESWGIVKALKVSTGMFAFALWDRQERQLALARDRIGEKPLYYGIQGGALLFASELNAIRQVPGFHGKVDKEVLALYFKHNAVPETFCIYTGFRKLKPGSILTIRSEDIAHNVLPDPQQYWSLHDAYQYGLENPFTGTDAESVDELERLFLGSITEQSIADVPLGAYLSGGVDSSAVVALMQSKSSKKVKTFTIGFADQEYNEAEYAKAVAKYLGTDHYELYITQQDALDVIPKLPEIYDEPFADSSQIPTFLVSQLARQHVTVSLSGDGGDELFCGYKQYPKALAHWRKIRRIPHALRKSIAVPTSWLLPDAQFGNEFLAKKIKAFSQKDIVSFYDVMVSQCLDASFFIAGKVAFEGNYSGHCFGQSLDALMAVDITRYLPSDILVKVDRAAMNVSLETRLPLLDYRIIEYAQRLPESMKIRNGESKWILRQLLYRYVPRELIERPKMGFGVPVTDWLRGSLMEWADDLLSIQSIKRCDLLYGKGILRKWAEHKSGMKDWSSQLWMVLMFMAWFNRYGGHINGY